MRPFAGLVTCSIKLDTTLRQMRSNRSPRGQKLRWRWTLPSNHCLSLLPRTRRASKGGSYSSTNLWRPTFDPCGLYSGVEHNRSLADVTTDRAGSNNQPCSIRLVQCPCALTGKIAFRGGTAIHKLLFGKPLRYYEDIDLALCTTCLVVNGKAG